MLKRIKGITKRAISKIKGSNRTKQINAPKISFRKPEIPTAAISENGGKFKIGLIGAGAQGRGMLRAARTLGGVECFAVADSNPAALAQLKAANEDIKYGEFADASDLLKQAKSLDLLIIATNSPSHVPLTRLAIEAGVKRICVEKPFGTNVADAISVLKDVEHRNAQVAVDFSRRWSDDFQAIRNFIRSGRAGEPKAAYTSFSTGGLAGKAIHFIDLLRFLFSDEISDVSCRLDPNSGSSTRGAEYVDPSGAVFLRFKKGARALVDVSADLKFGDRVTVITMSKGRIEIDERNLLWRVISAEGSFTVSMVDRPGGTMDVMRARLIVSMLTEKEPRAGIADAVSSLSAVIAAHVSSKKSGAFVSLPLSGEDLEFSVNFP